MPGYAGGLGKVFFDNSHVLSYIEFYIFVILYIDLCCPYASISMDWPHGTGGRAGRSGRVGIDQQLTKSSKSMFQNIRAVFVADKKT